MQNAARAEQLHMTQLAAQGQHETETRIHIVARVRQARANDQYPTLDGRRDEELFIAGQPLNPGTGFGMVQAQGGLDGRQIAALDGEPTSRTENIAGWLGSQTSKLCRLWLILKAMLPH